MRRKNKEQQDNENFVHFGQKRKQKQYHQPHQYHRQNHRQQYQYQQRRQQRYQNKRQNGEVIETTTRSEQPGTSTMVRPKVDVDGNVPIKLAVISDGYPEQKLDADQTSSIKDYLLERIDALDACSVSPKFEDVVEEDGVLVLICADAETSAWLYDVLKDCVPWQGAKLWLLDVKYLAATVKTTVFIPNHRMSSDHEKILHRFQIQNDLDTSCWMIVDVAAEDGGQRYVIMLDKSSWQRIEAKGFRLFFGFGKVDFILSN